jgi:sugar lactone lactonase YvrE
LNHTSAGPIVYTTVVSTLAGSSQGLTNEPGTVAKFRNPSGTAVDSSGNVYVADTLNHVIRKITSSGVVSTFAGDGAPGTKDGSGSNAQFNSPSAILISSTGLLYVSDTGNHRIRKITSTGIVSTFAGSTSGFQDGIGTNSQFNSPQGIVLDSIGNLYVADSGNHRIRIITSSGQVSTLAGQSTTGTTDDLGTSAKFNTPTGLAIDTLGNLYVTDKNNHRIRKVTAQGGVSTLAGSTVGFQDNTGTAAQFSSPVGIAIDSTGTLYVADTGNHRIRAVTSTGVVTTFVGLSTSGTTNGSPSQAQFNSPYSITVGTTGVFYVAEYDNHRIRKIVVTASDPNEYVFTPFIGTLITPLNSIPTTSSYIVVPERKTNTNIATFTIPLASMPSTTSIVGQWVIGLNASVALSANPGSFYFEVLDGTSSIVIGASNRVAQTSSGVILATLTVPARVYTTSLTLKLFVTTRDFSPMTLRFNGSTLSYLNTTIINVGPTGATGPHLFTIFNKLDHRVITSITDKSDQLLANSNLTFNGSNLNVVNTVTTSNFRGQGTVAAPPYAFTTDVTSGMSLPSASNLAFTTAGVERMRILPSGNIGIATPTPGFTLDVSGTANVSGNLSVGSITTAGGGFSVPGNLTGAIIRASSNGTAAVPVYTFSNDLSSGTFLPTASNLALTTAGVERVRILSNGNVGIATTTPGFILDVNGTANVSGNLSVGSITTAGGGLSVPGNLTGGIIRASSNGTAALPAYTFSNDLFSGTFLPAVSNLAFTTAGVERMRITNANVGIGTPTPGFTLDVSGTARITSNLTAGGTTVSSLTTSGSVSAGSAAVTDTLTAGGTTVSSLTTSGSVSAGSAAVTGTLTAGATTVSSLTTSGSVSAGSAAVTGTLTAGATTVSSLGLGSGNITTTGTVLSGIGAAATPSYTFSGNTTVGMFSPATNNVAWTTASTERMRILANGNVGIGRTDPSNTLDVSGTARITGATIVNSLGIGRTDPSNTLDVSGTARITGALTAGATIVNSLGIGRTDPTNTLDVSGTARITGALTAASASITDVSLNTINGSKYFAGGASGRTFQLNYSSGVAGLMVSTFKTGLSSPTGIAFDSAGILYVADNHRVQKITSDGTITLLAGSTTMGDRVNGNGATARFANIKGLAVDSSGNVYVTEGNPYTNFLRKITPSGEVTQPTTLTTYSMGLTISSSGDIYTINYGNHKIQKFTTGGVLSDFAGNGNAAYGNGTGGQVAFYSPQGITIDSAGNLYVTDSNNYRIRKVTSSGVASLLAGSGVPGNSDGIGASATFSYPQEITIDPTGTILYVADGNAVRKIVIATAEVTTVAGATGQVGNVNGVGSTARFNGISGVAVHPNGEIYVTDNANNSVRKLTAKSESTYDSTTLTGGTLSTEFDPRTPLGTIIVPGGKTNAKVVSFSLPVRYPYTSSITGQWILGLYATVGVPASPASFYFQIMDDTTSVATGSGGTLVNLSTPLQLYTYGLLIPARTYSSTLILNLYITTQASSSLTLEFSGSTLSYLNTTIQPYNDTVVANDYQIRTSNGILKLLSMSVLAITDNSNNVYTPLCYSLAERDLKNSFANYQLAPGCRLIVNTGATIHLDVTNVGTEWTFTAASVTVTAGTTKYKLYMTTI